MQRRTLPDAPEHEALCRRCGISCHLAIPVSGIPVVVPGLHCGFLRVEGGGRYGCSVYAERFERAPWCHHTAEAGPLGYLARDCPYALASGWRAGKIVPGRRAFAEKWPLLRAEIARTGVPDWIDGDAFLRALHGTLGEPAATLTAWQGQPGRLRVQFGGDDDRAE
ncbi:MAG: hypothetical protein RIT45_468 [Pseudomonadota bacterium]|jgi:hypothetical protein